MLYQAKVGYSPMIWICNFLLKSVSLLNTTVYCQEYVVQSTQYLTLS